MLVLWVGVMVWRTRRNTWHEFQPTFGFVALVTTLSRGAHRDARPDFFAAARGWRGSGSGKRIGHPSRRFCARRAAGGAPGSVFLSSAGGKPGSDCGDDDSAVVYAGCVSGHVVNDAAGAQDGQRDGSCVGDTRPLSRFSCWRLLCD